MLTNWWFPDLVKDLVSENMVEHGKGRHSISPDLHMHSHLNIPLSHTHTHRQIPLQRKTHIQGKKMLIID